LPPRQKNAVLRVLAVKAATVLAFLPVFAAASTKNPRYTQYNCQGGKSISRRVIPIQISGNRKKRMNLHYLFYDCWT
jgi:hypothetical protein